LKQIVRQRRVKIGGYPNPSFQIAESRPPKSNMRVKRLPGAEGQREGAFLR
jgi:hypothetical protein